MSAVEESRRAVRQNNITITKTWRSRAAASVVWAAFVATIPVANWTLSRYGFVSVPLLGSVASGVVWVGLAFVLRDLGQLLTSKWHTLAAVAVGVVLSYILADPFIAVASAWAFCLSELLDFSIYTPLARRRFVLAVLVSSIAGSFLDSALFLRLAFDSYDGWWQLAVAKSLVVVLAAPLAWGVRRAVLRKSLQ